LTLTGNHLQRISTKSVGLAGKTGRKSLHGTVDHIR